MRDLPLICFCSCFRRNGNGNSTIAKQKGVEERCYQTVNLVLATGAEGQPVNRVSLAIAGHLAAKGLCEAAGGKFSATNVGSKAAEVQPSTYPPVIFLGDSATRVERPH